MPELNTAFYKSKGCLHLHCGNIVDDEFLKLADAVVNSSNKYMRFGSGVCGQIFKKAGKDELETYTKSKFGITGPDSPNVMKIGEVRRTPGFNLPCDIIFTLTPKAFMYKTEAEAERMLIRTYINVLICSVSWGYKSILLSALGTGAHGFTHQKTAQKVIRLLKVFTDSRPLDIHFVLSKPEILDFYAGYI